MDSDEEWYNFGEDDDLEQALRDVENVSRNEKFQLTPADYIIMFAYISINRHMRYRSKLFSFHSKEEADSGIEESVAVSPADSQQDLEQDQDEEGVGQPRQEVTAAEGLQAEAGVPILVTPHMREHVQLQLAMAVATTSKCALKFVFNVKLAVFQFGILNSH